MPISSINKPPSKCRMWEKDRRNRLCAAFSDLAAVLPNFSPTLTKLQILQFSLDYIKQIQKHLPQNISKDSKHSQTDVILEEVDVNSREVVVLRRKCWEMVQMLLQAKLHLPSAPPQLSSFVDTQLETSPLTEEKAIIEVNQKSANVEKMNSNEVNKLIVSPKDDANKTKNNTKKGDEGNEIESVLETNKNLNVASTSEDSNKLCTECNLSNKPKNKRVPKKKALNRKHTRKKTKLPTISVSQPNVWVTSGGINTPVMLPLIPLAPPMLPPAPPTIFLLQRQPQPTLGHLPLLVNHSNRKPIGNVCSNIFGFDVTQTTMVNRVPISAFSTPLSMGKKKEKHLKIRKVTQRSKYKFMKSLKLLNDVEKNQLSPENDKENETENKLKNSTTKVNESTTNDDNAKESKVIGKNSDMEAKIVTHIEENKVQTEKIDEKTDCLKTKESVLEIEKCIDNQESSNKSTGIDQDKNNPNLAVNLAAGSVQVVLTEEPVKEITISKNKTNNVPCEVVQVKENIDLKKCSTSFQNNIQKECDSKKKIVQDPLPIISNISNTMLNSDCRLNDLKNNKETEVSINGNDLGEELWGTGAPLPPSPSSPTAAFLLTFPLVCPGPRPDTPLNDNLQTPNVCPVDHFSNFFSSKDSALQLTTQSNSIFMPFDCQPKVQSQASDTNKITWVPNSGYSKPPTTFRMDIPVTSNNKNVNIPNPKSNPVNKDIKNISSACVYSDNQNNLYQQSINSSGSYSLSESIFNYEHTPILNHRKTYKSASNNNKLFHFDNLPFDIVTEKSKLHNTDVSTDKTKLHNNDDTLYSCLAPAFNGDGTSIVYGNAEKDKYTLPLIGTENSIKKTREETIKLSMPTSLPEFTAVTSKPIDIPFSNTVNAKTVVSSSFSSIYTSCNTYNPFATDLPTNPTSFNTFNEGSSNNMRPKTSITYFPDFTNNIYTQSCNLWTEETNISGNESQKSEAKKYLPATGMITNDQTQSESQNYFRYPLPVVSKTTTRQNVLPTIARNNKVNQPKLNTSKDTKCLPQENKNMKSEYTPQNKNMKTEYMSQENKNMKTEYMAQKGPVNWMTSEVNFVQQNQDIMFIPSYNKESKITQNAIPQSTNQCSIDPNITTGTFPPVNKKNEIYNQPFYMPSGGYMPQAVNEDNQFTWSPSKLVPFAESVPFVPCSLPTLVGDLALGMGESKQSYQNLSLEQIDVSTKERKIIQDKNKASNLGKNHKPHSDVISNSNNVGNFLSVSQIMDRGKDDTAVQIDTGTNKPIFPYVQKRNNPNEQQTKNLNINLTNINKPYEAPHCSSMPFFPTEVFPAQQVTEYFTPLHSTKDNQYNKADTNKNRNNYSAESLLHTDTQYQNNAKPKNTPTVHKSYDASNLCISALNGNQNAPSTNIEYDNFSHNQSNISNGYPYSSSTVNTSFYPTSNYLSSTGTSASYNYIGAGYMPEHNDFSTPGEINFYTPKLENFAPKMENDTTEVPKYSFNNKVSPKDHQGKHKSDSYKKEVMIKRQKKAKVAENYLSGAQERCYSSMNSSMTDQDSFFGYYSSSQMHPYPSQGPVHPPPLPSQHSTTVQIQKSGISSVKQGMSASPNPQGTSLTNFNLSTIFPEINKRTMGGYA